MEKPADRKHIEFWSRSVLGGGIEDNSGFRDVNWGLRRSVASRKMRPTSDWVFFLCGRSTTSYGIDK